MDDFGLHYAQFELMVLLGFLTTLYKIFEPYLHLAELFNCLALVSHLTVPLHHHPSASPGLPEMGCRGLASRLAWTVATL